MEVEDSYWTVPALEWGGFLFIFFLNIELEP